MYVPIGCHVATTPADITASAIPVAVGVFVLDVNPIPVTEIT